MRIPIEVPAAIEFPLGFAPGALARALLMQDARASVRYSRSLGMIERIGRGRYRSLVTREDADEVKSLFDRVRDAALALPTSFPGAYDGGTAVFFWTRGGYVAGWTQWRVVIEVRVPGSRESAARRALRDLGIDVFAGYPPANMLGVFAKLNLAERVRRTFVGGAPVVTKRETLKLIRDNPGAFADAAGLIEDEEGEVEVLR